MTQTVRLDNGETMAVPDNYGPQEIKEAVRKVQGQQSGQSVLQATQTAERAMQPEPPGALEQFARETPQRVVSGLTAPLRGAAENVQEIGRMASGEGQIPEESEGLGEFEAFEASVPQQIKMAAGFMLNADPEARKDILRNTLGDEVQFSQDSEGNEIVEFGDERAFLNKPGFSMRDATQLAADVLKFVPAARLASGIRGAGGITRNIAGSLGGGGAAAGTEAVAQGASGLAGSEQGIDPVTVGAVGAGGALGEGGAALAKRLTPQARRATQQMRREGIDPTGEPGTQVRQVTQAAERRAAGERGEALEGIQRGLRQKERQERGRANQLFDEASQTDAAVPSDSVQGLRVRARTRLENEGFDVEDMPKVQRRLDDLDKEIGQGDTRLDSVKLNRLENWRKRINKNRSTDPAEQAALGRLKRQYDDWINEQFNADMVQGDREAVRKWQEAREAWKGYRERFSEDKAIKNLIEEDFATPESMRNWILNSSEVRMNKQAGEVVRRLNELLGPNSPEMGRLRGEVWLNIVDPLLSDNPLKPPNISQFLSRYDEVVKKNPTLVKNLWPEGKKELEDLVGFARGIARRPGAQPKPESTQSVWDRLWDGAVTLTVGHGIAKGGFRTRTGRGIVDSLRRTAAGRQGRKTILREALGIEPTEPMIRPGLGTLLGATSATQEDAENPPPR